jgi:hypothetical protein
MSGFHPLRPAQRMFGLEQQRDQTDRAQRRSAIDDSWPTELIRFRPRARTPISLRLAVGGQFLNLFRNLSPGSCESTGSAGPWKPVWANAILVAEVRLTLPSAA